MNKSIFLCAAVIVACSSSGNNAPSPNNPGVGGSANSSGGTSTSALASTGGSSDADLGGSSSTGGAVGTGGKVAATGGAATGGQISTKSATGGRSTVNPVTGGAKPTGGSTASVSTGGNAVAGSSPGGSATCVPAPTTYPNLFVTVSGHTQDESDSKVSKAWSSLFNPSGSGTIYYNGPGSDESYVQDIYNNDVRSEGMSYGMMVAVQLDHQTEFDRLWTWVKNHMAQNCSGDKCTGEIAWSCSTSGSKKSNGGAPDGEEYFATALIFAHNRWGDTGKFKYGTEAQWVLDLIRTKYFHTNPHLVKFVANANTTDPSYILPAFYQAWACFDTANAAFWNTAITDGRAFFHKGTDSNGVCPYQSSWDGSNPQAANSDSVRCVVNLMMDYNFFKADSWQAQTYAPKFAAHEKNAGPPSSYCDATLGFGLPAADGKAFVDKIWSAGVPSHDYWNGVLYMLALLHVSGNFKLYY
jgi:oligosaccharide reducing-end xylanase